MIYQLKYTDEAQAISDLTSKGVLIEGDKATHIEAIVWIGLLVDVQGDEETETTFLDGYHVDIMSDIEIKFDADNLVVPKSPKHTFFY